MVTSYTKPPKQAQGGQGLKSPAAAATQAASVSANQAAFKSYQQASSGSRSSLGRNISVEIGETLRLSDSPVETAVKYTRTPGSGGGQPPKTQEGIVREQTRTKGVPIEEVKRKGGRDLSVTLDENLGITASSGGPQTKGAVSPYGGYFALGAQSFEGFIKELGKLSIKGGFAKLSPSERETERELKPLESGSDFVRTFRQPIFNIEKSIADLPRGFKDVIEGKNIVTSSERGFNPLRLPVPEPTKGIKATASTRLFSGKLGELSDPKKLAENVISGASEVTALALTGGGAGFRFRPGPKVAEPGKFTSTKIETGAEGVKSYVYKEGPLYDPEVYQRTVSINLGKGRGKTLLRESGLPKEFTDVSIPKTGPFKEIGKRSPPRRSRIYDKDTAEAIEGFKNTNVDLGTAIGRVQQQTQKQSGGLQTVVKQKQPEPKDILISKPRFTQQDYSKSAGGYYSEAIIYPLGSTPKTILTQPVKTINVYTDSTLQKATNPAKELERQYAEGIKATKISQQREDELTTSLKSGVAPVGGLSFREGFGYVKLTSTPKQTPDVIQRIYTGTKTDTPTKTTTTTIQPPIFRPPSEPIPRPILKPPAFIPPWLPRGYFGSGGYGQSKSGRRVYEAFGISEDINIKYIERVLPKTPIIRTSYSPGRIYQQLSKEDKKAMDLFYGKKTRKSYKSKGRKRKR